MGNYTRIFETTQFWNESHYFIERVQNTLRYADFFVIAESEDSFSQKISRPLVVPKLLETLPKAEKDRVLFVPVNLKHLSHTDHWTREAFVRQAGFEYLKSQQLIQSSDIILVQDFDEFFDPSKKQDLINYFKWPWRKYVHPRYLCTYYYLNCLVSEPKDHADWTLQIAFRASLGLNNPEFSIHKLRTRKSRKISKDHWGWHHSYLGNIDFITEKIKAFAHADDDLITKVSPEEFKKRLLNQEDLFGRQMKFKLITNYSEIGIPDLTQRKDLQF